jgi:hypothetical protein
MPNVLNKKDIKSKTTFNPSLIKNKLYIFEYIHFFNQLAIPKFDEYDA